MHADPARQSTFDDPSVAARAAVEATGADRRARLAAVSEVAGRVAPVVLARELTLPLTASLVPLFPDAALRRGITIGIDGPGAASLAVALSAAPVRAGSWVAFVDLPGLNLAAAVDAGIALERVACIATGDQWAAAVAALLGAFDLVVIGMRHRVRAGDVRRLGARARERGSVLVTVRGVCGTAVWPEAPDLTLRGIGSQWTGLEPGHGHLRSRVLQVEAEGRRSFSRPRRAEVIVPQIGPEIASGPAVDARPTSPRPAEERPAVVPLPVGPRTASERPASERPAGEHTTAVARAG